MRKLLIAGICALSMASCVKVEFNEDYSTDNGGKDTTGTGTSTVISGKVVATTIYKKGKYTLKGYTYVTNGAQLIFEPGCVIVSDVAEKGALIVERGAKLVAEGTATEPIIFTSGKAPNERAPGDWGGIILLGKAPTNRPLSPEPIIEGGVNRTYGGTDPSDNSGALRYVRIEFAGIAAEPGSEINGLTCGGVGSGTLIDHVQVSYGNDDAYEFFGGNVNSKYLIAFGTRDDDYDFDFGFTGAVQFGISLRDKPSDSDQANGVECDNDGSGSAATPFTHPVMVNCTLIGPYDTTGSSALHGFGNRWRRNTRFTFRNSIMIGHRLGGFVMESDGTVQAYKSNESEFKQNLVHAYTKVYSSPNQAIMTNDQVKAKAEADGVKFLADKADAQLTDPFNLNAPNFVPKAGSPAIEPALVAADYTGLASFIVAGTFRGAMGTTDWTTGWASFTPQTNTY